VADGAFGWLGWPKLNNYWPVYYGIRLSVDSMDDNFFRRRISLIANSVFTVCLFIIASPPSITWRSTYVPVANFSCDGSAFQQYEGGIYTMNTQPANCTNHAVLIAGLKDNDDCIPTEIIKNSWGIGWGKWGYMQIKRAVLQVEYGANYVEYIPLPQPPPENDDIDTAKIVDASGGVVNYTDSINTTFATKVSDDPSFSKKLGKRYRSVWYQFTPTETGRLTVDTTGSNFNTVLGVWSGSRGSLKSIAMNDNANATSKQSALETLLFGNTTYYIEVASYTSDGMAQLTLNLNYELLSTAVIQSDLYDDTDDTNVFGGYWTEFTGKSGAYQKTLHISKKIGENMVFKFSGNQITLIYSRMRQSGVIDVYIDGIKHASINQSTTGKNINQQKWKSGDLGSAGPHLLVLTHSKGKMVNLDAIQVSETPTILGTGTDHVENTDKSINYRGFWQDTFGIVGSSNGTFTTSTSIGDTAILNFSGDWIALIYTRVNGGGILGVSIDGAQVANINQSIRSKPVYQVNWVSDKLNPSISEHTIVLTHLSGKVVNFDAFVIGDESDIWIPSPVTSWQIQFTELLDKSLAVEMYEIDMDVAASDVAELHSAGKKVVCYISAGSWENWRSDAKKFPKSIIGRNYDGWPGEKWLDIRKIQILSPIISARVDICKEKGFDAVEFDNVNGYTNSTGFRLTYQDQLNYNRFLANLAHSRGMSVALKNDIEQIVDLTTYFDWTLNEECFEYQECDYLTPFVTAGKAVFNIEYNQTIDQFCADSNKRNFNSLRKNRDLGIYREACR